MEEEDPLARALEYLHRGQLDRAAEAAQRAATTGAGATDQLLLLAEIFQRQGLAGEALERFRSAAERAGGAKREQAVLGAARAALELGRARDALDLVNGLSRADVRAMRLRARALAALGRYDEAAQTLEPLRTAGGAGALTELGTAYLVADRLEEAEQALRAALDEDDEAVAARVAMGHVLARTQRAHLAVQEYDAALALLPSHGAAALALAEIHRDAGRTEDGVRVLVDLLAVDPYHLDALTQLGLLLHEAGRRAEAVAALHRVLRIDPDHAARAELERIDPDAAEEV